MRIISGKYRRTNLMSLDGNATRPTKDMVKEALFDSLQVSPGEKMLDLFAGSGAIGIEMISRGGVTDFNDVNRQAIKIIEANLDKIHEEAKVLCLEYAECLRKEKNGLFDYLFADPPYAFEEYENIFELAEKYSVMKDNGIIVLEVKSDRALNEDIGSYHLYKEKKYGISKLLYYRRKQ